ncbi:MAG: hypothetical protein OXE74_00035 [Cyanobacteria bacterium MAG CAR2_bin_4]|nr:hypothetical protein [Cyanobacteria bacterium MAG CAR2_bin_4]
MTIQSTPLLEEAKILALLREQGHPLVADWKVKVGEDSFDYPAVWVWVILEAFQELEQRDAIRKQVRERIAQGGDDRWVYVRFRTTAEQDDLDALERQEALENSREASA